MSWVLSAFADEAGSKIEDQIKALQRGGIKHVDLRGIDTFNITTLPTELAKQVQQKLSDAGIGVAMFGSPIGKIDINDDFQTDINRLRHLAELAPIFNCKSVRMFSYYNKQNAPKDQWQTESLSRLSQLRDEAAKLGMKLYHENESHIFGDHPAENLVILKTLRDGKHFFGIFDFSNYNMGGDDVYAAWKLLQPFTDCIHLKDSNKEKVHVPLGQGAGHVKTILSEALKAGWHGPLTLEPHLAHSKAVLATGPSGQVNVEYAKLSHAESFQIAADAAQKLLKEIGAPVV